MASTTPSTTSGMPKGIPYIITNEAAERFSFYGMKGILVIFMSQYLWLMSDTPGEQMSDAKANEYYHLFGAFVYLTPLLGALLADIVLGKYRTIIALSLVYVAGHACLAFMGFVGSAGTWLAVGLGLICLGSGGIKPCVSAHVGDQFGPNNQHLLTKIFNWFYFSINLGSTFATLAIPWTLEWYGPHWAFGIPGVLMAIATLFFWLGRNQFVHIPPGGKEFAKELFSKKGLGSLAKLIPLYIFVSFFWMLFDQTGSSWIFQAQDMDLRFLGTDWLPSQVQASNPILILILVPLFSFVIYPQVGKVVKLTPLRKMGAGLFLTVLSFAIVALTQVAIENGARPNVGWQFFAFFIITAAEVMVSIVCLEYSYTQAPKNMKSFVMAVFFLSVFLGNFITSAINGAIQVDDPTTELVVEDADTPKLFVGYDGEPGTADDVELSLVADKAKITALPSQAALDDAYDKILAWAQDNGDTLPTTEDASIIIQGITDQWGNALIYKRLTSQTARLSSAGGDGVEGTQWDIGYQLKTELKLPAAEGEVADKGPTWLERRKAELGVVDPVADTSEVVAKVPFTGGQPKLEGSSYFWFFTALMAIASILFIPYSLIIKRLNAKTEAEA